MVDFVRVIRSRRATRGAGLALALLVALLPATWQKPAAEDLIDLTLLFHSAVQGKVDPCG
jgi:hypothetical protein